MQGASDGSFVGETIGYTRPGGGNVGQGTYAVVYDECQNGKVDSEDAVFDPAFEVVINHNIPSFEGPAFSAIKADAVYQQRKWERGCFRNEKYI